jgi:L-ascorbate metabolism protein UlaG (beta-lactamase superfamily)
VITPLGNDAILTAHDSSIRAEAHDWAARVRVSESVAVHLEPSYHWSARGLGDRRMALWCAFVIEAPGGNIYVVADTGYRDGAIFRQMKAKHGGFRLALLPIGAYAPRWFMKDQHINPEEAVKIMRDAGAMRAIAHHWGTFKLTDEAVDEPPRLLAEALAGAGLGPEVFAVKRPGEVWEG